MANRQQFKVVLLGEGCVGKTSIILRYLEDKFNDKHYQTLQVGVTPFFTLKYFALLGVIRDEETEHQWSTS